MEAAASKHEEDQGRFSDAAAADQNLRSELERRLGALTSEVEHLNLEQESHEKNQELTSKRIAALSALNADEAAELGNAQALCATLEKQATDLQSREAAELRNAETSRAT